MGDVPIGVAGGGDKSCPLGIPVQRAQLLRRDRANTPRPVARTCGRRRRSAGGARSTRPVLRRSQRLAGSESRPADTISAFSEEICADHEQGAPLNACSFFAWGITVFELF